jgi:hypothetical protein
MAVVVEDVVGAAAGLVGVPAHWRRKKMMEASTQHRGRWGWRQLSTAPEFPTGFPPGRDHQVPFGMTGRASRA